MYRGRSATGDTIFANICHLFGNFRCSSLSRRTTIALFFVFINKRIHSFVQHWQLLANLFSTFLVSSNNDLYYHGIQFNIVCMYNLAIDIQYMMSIPMFLPTDTQTDRLLHELLKPWLKEFGDIFVALLYCRHQSLHSHPKLSCAKQRRRQ